MSTQGPRASEDSTLDAVRTLAAVADPTPASDHSSMWGHWYKLASARRPVLEARRTEDPSDPTATHEFLGLGDVRIGARLLLPRSGPVRGAVVTSHGYVVNSDLETYARRWQRVTDTGLAVLLVRVRGYPGSRLDTGDLTRATPDSPGWITQGLLDPNPEKTTAFMSWVVPQAVADLSDGCRVMRNLLLGRSGLETPEVECDSPAVHLHGESLGGGLALLASAQLTGRLQGEGIVSRLAVGLPTFGAWEWRLANHPMGSAADVARLLEDRPDDADRIRNALHLCDAVVHAARVRLPTLCKLALRDEIVPAWTAAAVFNALACDPGEKWRFVTTLGHSDLPMADARRHAMFERAIDDFFDPRRTPADAMEPWEPLLNSGDRPPEIKPDPAPAMLFEGGLPARERDRVLIEAYERAGRTLDSLPYTPEFDEIHALAHEAGLLSPRDVFHRLHNLRKAGRLPKLGKAPERAPTLEKEDEQLLEELVRDAVGTLGQRDQLPFTPEFDALAERFNARTGLSMTNHDLWRVIAKLAK